MTNTALSSYWGRAVSGFNDVQLYKFIPVIDNGYALAYARAIDLSDSYTGILVMVLTDDHSEFYDEKIIEAPEGKCFRQVGTYWYESKSEIWKTVPVIEHLDK